MVIKQDPLERAYNALTTEQRRAVGTLADFRRAAAAKEAEAAQRADALDAKFGLGAYDSTRPQGTSYDAKTGAQTFGVSK